ncbi:MAG: aminoglycoside phosphotransferase family protein [Clostridia bacterium]|nr:aminoglycoside phosphotransferase family protein [Clostridia bacterium]
MNQLILQEVLDAFGIKEKVVPYGNGHINDTYCSVSSKYIIQRINTDVFQDADALMGNIERVTEFLKKKIIAEGGDPERETLTVVKTVDGKPYYKFDDDNVFRVYLCIGQTYTIESDKTPEDMYNAGKGFGKFQQMLADFDAESLNETIVDFHNTPKRVEALKQAIAEDRAGRADSVRVEIDFALKNAEFSDIVVNGIKSGDIPLRVTHNDTKINNILYDEQSGEAIAVIDLDTVMPGSMLYDFGDALRMGASTAAEDETNLDDVRFDKECFEAFARGYLAETKSVMSPMELELLPFSVKLLTYECGTRFLTDYLNGDIYFKIHRENHNLDRARNQFKLVSEIAKIEDELKEIVRNI